MAMPALGCSHKAETGIITIPSGSFSYCTELSDDGYVMVGRSQLVSHCAPVKTVL